MHIASISNLSFQAGNVRLKNIIPEELHNYETVKKLATDKDVDIFITKKQKSKNALPFTDIYTVLATKNNKIIKNEKSYVSNKRIRGTSFAVMSERASSEEVSVRVYNAVINAVENLEKLL